MTDESLDEEVAIDPATLLRKVESQVKTNKLLLTVVITLSLILTAVLATSLTVMYVRITELTDAAEQVEEDPMEDQFLEIEQQLLLLAEFRKSEEKKIALYTEQLNKISKDCSLEKASPYRDFLVAREQDFLSLVNIVKSGTVSLANMSKGSKQWLMSYQEAMDEIQKSSEERKKILDGMLKPEGNK